MSYEELNSLLLYVILCCCIHCIVKTPKEFNSSYDQVTPREYKSVRFCRPEKGEYSALYGMAYLLMPVTE